ncbi:hypothetical protein [Halobacillus karajensis]|uniref:Uncharacterized protein n=1 Tax=Halobacillus karajensis TaxID=195088 RepID=A0A059NYP8_9BACI|nr:hypothetical protein [Halobacillus karajensis]CDQ22622.1 hypothetical protein BN983_00835 [Halobacillus karajensis]CDQ26104.1 hypothetical protein BN981_00315 [Halobacillus karajensis]
MNTYLKKELFDKVLLAHSKNTQYRFSLELDDSSFRVTVFAHHTRHHITASYTLAEYESFLHDDPKAEEKALNYAIAELNYFAKYPELKNGIRLAMYQEMQRKCKALNKDDEWIADYLNLDEDVVKELSA